MGNPFFPSVTLTNDIYRASKAPAVRALYALPSGTQRDILAQQLAGQGYLLDVPIDMWNWDAVTTMAVRAQLGFTWVPSALQAPLNGAIGTGPVPLGAIKVSTNAADYPPYDPPVVPVVATNLVGPLVFNNIYTYGPGTVKDGVYQVTDGQIVTQDGASFKAHVSTGLMGVAVYFEKVS